MRNGPPGRGSRQGAEEIDVATRLHGRPLQRLNNLARWSVRASLIGMLITALVLILSGLLVALFPEPNPRLMNVVYSLLLTIFLASFVLFGAGMGAKFLPSSFGGKTHLHSLNNLLWSFWIVVLVFPISMLGLGLALVFGEGLFPVILTVQLLAAALLATGLSLLTWNFWKTMQPRR